MSLWGKKEKKQTNASRVPENARENSAKRMDTEDKFTDWVESSVKDYEKTGGFKELPGHGKPLSKEYLKGDVFTGILKNANYSPPWVDLQHNIRDSIGKLILAIENQEAIDIDDEIIEINQHIRKYNQMCPSPVMQKGLLSVERMKQQYERWK
jgi:hypothetical protein